MDTLPYPKIHSVGSGDLQDERLGSDVPSFTLDSSDLVDLAEVSGSLLR